MDDPTFELERIALNMDQIKLYNPPPAPVKPKDSRTPGYIRQHGSQVWELDAMKPKVIVELVSNRIAELCDIEKFEEAKKIEARNRREIAFVGKNYDRALSLLLHVDHEAEK